MSSVLSPTREGDMCNTWEKEEEEEEVISVAWTGGRQNISRKLLMIYSRKEFAPLVLRPVFVFPLAVLNKVIVHHLLEGGEVGGGGWWDVMDSVREEE